MTGTTTTGTTRGTTRAMTRGTTGDRSQSAASPERSPATPSGRRKRTSLAPHREQIESWVRQGASDEWIASALGTTANSIQSFRSRSGIVRVSKGRSGAESVYEGVLEHAEAGKEEGCGLWLDPAVAEDPAFRKGFSGVQDVEVYIGRDRIVLRPLRATDSEAERLEGFQPGLAGFEAALGPLPASNREEGEVKFFEPAKGYGFIRRPDGGEIFVHKSQINGGNMLAAGVRVSYEVGSNQRGLVAEDVKAAG